MIRYQGERTIDGPIVLRDGQPFHMRQGLRYGDGQAMDWGCDAPGARELAFALLVDHLDDAERAKRLAPTFSSRVIARLDNEWELDSPYLDEAVSLFERS
jgi:hypothetical protein